MIAVARTIKWHEQNVLTCFTHPVTNPLAESLISKSETIQKRA